MTGVRAYVRLKDDVVMSVSNLPKHVFRGLSNLPPHLPMLVQTAQTCLLRLLQPVQKYYLLYFPAPQLPLMGHTHEAYPNCPDMSPEAIPICQDLQPAICNVSIYLWVTGENIDAILSGAIHYSKIFSQTWNK